MDKNDPIFEKLKGSLTDLQSLQLEHVLLKRRVDEFIDSMEGRLSAGRSYRRDLSIAVIAAIVGAVAAVAVPQKSSSSAQDGGTVTIVPNDSKRKPSDTPFIPQG